MGVVLGVASLVEERLVVAGAPPRLDREPDVVWNRDVEADSAWILFRQGSASSKRMFDCRSRSMPIPARLAFNAGNIFSGEK